jgi:hypothetical protein
MANDLAGYRVDIGNLLATAVDSSTWTTAIIDQALRMALEELNTQLIYEASFTVVTTGYQQDVSTITAINGVVSVAYPWVDGAEFGHCIVPWRMTGNNLIYFSQSQPATGEVIRVRYTKLHAIKDLDTAAATTAPDQQRGLLGLWGAAYACDLRIRQVSENPALPKEASNHLARTAATFRKRASEAISHVPPLGRLRWGNVGLD